WVVGIAVAHPGDEAAGHAQGKSLGRPRRKRAGQAVQAEQREQFARVAHGVAPGLLPAGGRCSRLLQVEGGCGYHGGLGLSHPLRTAGAPRMATYGMNDVKNGMKILVNNDPCIITDTEYVKPGKGQAFTRVKYRNIKNGRVQEVTMKATDTLEAADVMDTDMQFLYSDGEYWHFMNPETFEQVQADKAGMGGAEHWLKGEEECVVTLWNGAPITVQPPNFVED